MTPPDEVTEVRRGGEAFLIRVYPAGTPRGFAIASVVLTAVSVAWTRFVRRDRTWHLRVRRYADDPMGEVLHYEVAPSADAASECLARLRADIEAGRAPWRADA